MAPRKNSESKNTNVTKKTQEKKPKEKLVKQRLKTPTVIKIKIPFRGSSNTISSNTVTMSPKKTTKLTKKQIALEKKALEKLDLANEVAAAQLAKKPIVKPEPIQNAEVKVPKKRGRPRLVAEEPITTTSADSEDAFEPSPVKKKPRRIVLKKSATPKPASVKKSLSLTPRKNLKLNKTTEVNSEIKTPKRKVYAKKKNPSGQVTEVKTEKSKLNAEKGKLNIGEALRSDMRSPILQEATTAPNESSTVSNIEAGIIDSRKTSLNSELSWTKDISSSSTTTCLTVCSTDFVRIDKKIPVLKLPNIGLTKLENNYNFSSTTSENSVIDQPVNSKDDRESTPDVDCRSLDLSTSSVTPTKSVSSLPSRENSYQNTVINEEISKTSKALDKLTSKLKKFDLEIINWIGYDDEDVNVDLKRFQGQILRVLKEESEVIAHCQRLKRVLADNVIENDKNADCVDHQDVDKVNISKELSDHRKGVENIEPRSPVRTGDEAQHNVSTERVPRERYKSTENCYDDDDALSLFAESITGMDTSTRNSCAASVGNPAEVEEYIPQPVTKERWEPAKRISYNPTPLQPPIIFNTERPVQDKSKTVCEKQNADSTSIRDTDQERYKAMTFDDNIKFNMPPVIRSPNPKIRNDIIQNKKQPGFMCFNYKQPRGTRSSVLSGYCFFNLLSSCKVKNLNTECRYNHEIPTNGDITAKLVRLSEEMFIQEYMLFRDWPILRRKYGMCFVEECMRRDLTRILVEMSIDFTMRAVQSIWEDTQMKVEVMELVLMHLNSVDLDLCEDLLKFKLYNVALCNLFMQTIANTQNFSRFKPVFIKLTKFILDFEGYFSFEVATQILERLAILPCEIPLLEALLDIVKHTDVKILENPMMGHFEKQLSAHKELHDQFLEWRKEGCMSRPVLGNLYEPSPRVQADIQPLMSMDPSVVPALITSEKEKRYTSPDTTNLDNMNKPTEEPVITPTVEFNRAHLFGTIQRTFANSNSSNDSDEFKMVAKNTPNYKSWRGKTIFNNIRGMSPILRHPSPRPGIRRHVQMQRNLGMNPLKYQRRSGPDYY